MEGKNPKGVALGVVDNVQQARGENNQIPCLVRACEPELARTGWKVLLIGVFV